MAPSLVRWFEYRVLPQERNPCRTKANSVPLRVPNQRRGRATQLLSVACRQWLFFDISAGATNGVGCKLCKASAVEGPKRERPAAEAAAGRSLEPKLLLRFVLVFPARATAVGRLDVAATGSAFLVALTVRLIVALLLIGAVALVVGYVVSSLS
jgi:hypothetical protein